MAFLRPGISIPTLSCGSLIRAVSMLPLLTLRVFEILVLKIQRSLFFQAIKELEKDLGGKSVHLHSFIVSSTPLNEVPLQMENIKSRRSGRGEISFSKKMILMVTSERYSARFMGKAEPKFLVIAKRPGDCTDVELADFRALVLAGGEVEREGLERRILKKAEWLILLRENACLVSIGALKRPDGSHRHDIGERSGIKVTASDYPFEYGWVFVLPSSRGSHYSYFLTETAVSLAKGQGLFATARVENGAIHKALEKNKFIKLGEPFKSKRGNEIQLFVLRQSQK